MHHRVKKPKQVTVRLRGGMGNQLFSFCAALRFSIRNESELFIDDETGFQNDLTYNRSYELNNFQITCPIASRQQKMKPFATQRHKIVRRFNDFMPTSRKNYISHLSLPNEPALLSLQQHARQLTIEGYWQSEDYFIDIENIVRHQLQFNAHLSNTISCYRSMIGDDVVVALHFRVFEKRDFLHSEYVTKVKEYYYNSMSLLDNRLGKAKYMVFTNEISIARQVFGTMTDKVIFANDCLGSRSSIVDLALMSSFKNLIIGNSTFSWWAAWLSNDIEKCIIAPRPRQVFGKHWLHSNLIPSSWITL